MIIMGEDFSIREIEEYHCVRPSIKRPIAKRLLSPGDYELLRFSPQRPETRCTYILHFQGDNSTIFVITTIHDFEAIVRRYMIKFVNSKR